MSETKTYIIKCECEKIVESKYKETAEDKAKDDLIFGGGCESAEVISIELSE